MDFDNSFRARDVEALVYAQFADLRSEVSIPENESQWPRVMSTAGAVEHSISVCAAFILLIASCLWLYTVARIFWSVAAPG